jgi:hypothetical protein
MTGFAVLEKGETMRLIDADAVAEAINDEIEITAESGTHEANVCKGGLIMGLVYVNTAPTIDAVPVVRCKDCRDREVCITSDDWYCADAERSRR